MLTGFNDYIIPSDNREQQHQPHQVNNHHYYIIPSDNREQQLSSILSDSLCIISYQAITGNNNQWEYDILGMQIISYQAITGNNNFQAVIL